MSENCKSYTPTSTSYKIENNSEGRPAKNQDDFVTKCYLLSNL